MKPAKSYAFKGKLLSLYVEKKRFPNGYVANLEIVKHPGAVLIVPFLTKDKIVLIRQYRPIISSNIWELPAGTLSENEAPLSCAKRELVEEIGYRAQEWKKIGYIYPAPGYTTEKILIYKARKLKKCSTDLQDDEVITSRIVSKKSIKNLFKTGRIIDAKTICALTLSGVL